MEEGPRYGSHRGSVAEAVEAVPASGGWRLDVFLSNRSMTIGCGSATRRRRGGSRRTARRGAKVWYMTHPRPARRPGRHAGPPPCVARHRRTAHGDPRPAGSLGAIPQRAASRPGSVVGTKSGRPQPCRTCRTPDRWASKQSHPGLGSEPSGRSLAGLTGRRSPGLSSCRPPAERGPQPNESKSWIGIGAGQAQPPGKARRPATLRTRQARHTMAGHAAGADPGLSELCCTVAR